MADDMGRDDPGYKGNPVIKTSNLDAMSRAGVHFDRFYAATVGFPTRGRESSGLKKINEHLISFRLTVAFKFLGLHAQIMRGHRCGTRRKTARPLPEYR